MKFEDLFDENNEDHLFEMSNFRSNSTGLNGLEVWVRSDLGNHGHNRYRIKIRKNKIWAAIFTVSSNPILVNDINSSLTQKEQMQVLEWIKKNSSLIISHIDDKLTSGQLEYELQKRL